MGHPAGSAGRLNRFSRASLFPPATLSRVGAQRSALDRGPACGKQLREEKRFSHNRFSLTQRVDDASREFAVDNGSKIRRALR